MKFSIKKYILQSSLQKSNKVIPARSTLPILSCVLFETDNDSLTLRATDLEITLIQQLQTENAKKGKIAIPIKAILEITNEMPDGIIDFEISDIGKVKIISEYGKYTIMGKPADEFPSIPPTEKPNETTIQAKELSDIIDNTLYAVSKDEMKPALQGVLFQIEENSVGAVATDGHRLVKILKNNTKVKGQAGTVIIPAKFLSVIYPQLDNEKEVTLIVGENNIQISLNGTTVTSRIIKERFPDYESVIPKENEKKIIVNKEDLLHSVKRVSIFSNRSTKQITLNVEKNKILVTTEDPENITTGNEVIPCTYESEKISIGYNAQYLKEVLNHQKSEELQIKLKSSVTAGIILPLENTKNEELTTLLMPIRLID